MHVRNGYSISSALGVAEGLAIIGVQNDVDESNTTKASTPDWQMLEMALENIIKPGFVLSHKTERIVSYLQAQYHQCQLSL